MRNTSVLSVLVRTGVSYNNSLQPQNLLPLLTLWSIQPSHSRESRVRVMTQSGCTGYRTCVGTSASPSCCHCSSLVLMRSWFRVITTVGMPCTIRGMQPVQSLGLPVAFCFPVCVSGPVVDDDPPRPPASSCTCVELLGLGLVARVFSGSGVRVVPLILSWGVRHRTQLSL